MRIDEPKYISRRNLRIWIQEYKESTPCEECGKRFPHNLMVFQIIGEGEKMQHAIQSCDFDRVEASIGNSSLLCYECAGMNWSQSKG